MAKKTLLVCDKCEVSVQVDDGRGPTLGWGLVKMQVAVAPDPTAEDVPTDSEGFVVPRLVALPHRELCPDCIVAVRREAGLLSAKGGT